MSDAKGVSRRSFLSRSAWLGAAALAGPTIIPSGVLAAPGKPGANDRIAIGMIGVGRRGKDFLSPPAGAEIVAISDLNQKRLDELAAKHPTWKTYQDYRKMLESSDVDAVIVATPDHWHTLCSIHACQAGKDVYCEKPMTLTVREGRALVDAVRANNRVFQTGSQQRSMEACRLGCELVRSGRIGKVHTVHASNFPSPWECDLPEQPVPEGLDWDMWCGQTQPRAYHEELYLPRIRGTEAGWISFRPYSGGEMTGWGAHGLDIIQWALGMDDSGPVEVWPEPGTERPPTPQCKGPNCQVTFRYANGVVVHLDGKGPGGGGVFVGDKGQILIDRGKCESKPDEIAKTPLAGSDVRLYRSADHVQNWLDCIRSREKPICDVEIGHRTVTMCHLGNIARWLGRKLQWDPAAESFVGARAGTRDEEANGLMSRPMRAPWSI